MSASITGNDKPKAYGRALARPLLGEGEDGLFTQSWFPICMSSDVQRGRVIGREFLDGRVVVVRGEDGQVSVMSAYCPHLGADLSVGDVVGNEVRCAFHHWCYDRDGKCARTGIGDPPPPLARLFKFPTRERYGLIWAFNGEQPLFELPDYEYPDEQLVWKVIPYDIVNIDPWVAMCNTLDLQHLKLLHGIIFKHDDPDEDIHWSDFAVHYSIQARYGADGPNVDYRFGIYGSNIFYRSGRLEGDYIGGMAPMCVLRPGVMRSYLCSVTLKGDGSQAALAKAEQMLRQSLGIAKRISGEDLPIFHRLRFKPGHLTKSDKALGKFLQHLRRLPRAHPSAEYIK